MVNLEMLKDNKEVRELCKKILREDRKALEILDKYTDNVEKVMEYAWQYINENISGIQVLRSSSKRFTFYTPLMSEFFSKRGASIKIDDTHLKFYCNAEIDGGVSISFCLEKLKGSKWDDIQLELVNRFGSGKKLSSRFFSLNDFSVALLDESEREVDFNQIEYKIEKRMKQYVLKLRELEEKLV